MRMFVLLGLVACGDSGPDRPTGPIEVHVDFVDHTPAADIDVVLHDDAGEVVSVARTGADGVVAFEDPTVSMVSMVAADPNGGRTVWTKTGLQGGDTPWFTLPYGGSTTQPPAFMADLSITVPPNPPGGATTFAIDFGCEGTSGPATTLQYTMQNDCRRPGTNELDAVVLAMNGTTVTGYSFLKAVQVVTGGTTQFDFPAWHSDPLQVVAQYANVPASVTRARLSIRGSVESNAFYPDLSQVVSVPPAPSRSYVVARGFYTAIQHTVEVDYGGTGWGMFGESAAAPTTNGVTMFDLGETLLPAIDSATLVDATTARPTIRWTQASAQDAASGGYAGFSWTDGSWVLELPPDNATSARVPALPAELAAFEPPSDGAIADPYVQFDRYSNEPTYADHLARHGAFTTDDVNFALTRFPSVF